MKESMNYSDNATVATAVLDAEEACGTAEERKAIPAGEPPADTEIAAAALDAIHCITTVPTDSMKITAQQGRLFLRGTVESLCQREVVEDAVRNLNGVADVANLIELRPGEPRRHRPA